MLRLPIYPRRAQGGDGPNPRRMRCEGLLLRWPRPRRSSSPARWYGRPRPRPGALPASARRRRSSNPVRPLLASAQADGAGGDGIGCAVPMAVDAGARRVDRTAPRVSGPPIRDKFACPGPPRRRPRVFPGPAGLTRQRAGAAIHRGRSGFRPHPPSPRTCAIQIRFQCPDFLLQFRPEPNF